MKHSCWYLMFNDFNWSCIFGGKYFTPWLFAWHWTPIFTYYLSELFFSFFQHAKMIQNKFQLNSSKSWRGPVVNTITLLVYICLSPGFSSLRCRRPFIMKYEASAPHAMGSWKWVEVQEHWLTGFVQTGGLTS